MKKYSFLVTSILCLMILSTCQKKETPISSAALIPFTSLSSDITGITFNNKIEDQEDFNVLTYRNYYNGGGVAIGDINNDGLLDIYFTANMTSNRLFLNEGNMSFKDITTEAGVEGNKPWSTGVTMADVNGDGWLDIYVCNSGDVEGNEKQNELYINNGDLTFSESAETMGLDDAGFSTHASFFDYDSDGDLDVYILNNSFKDPRRIDYKNVRNERNKEGGDKLMRNDNNSFIDVSEEAGIYGSKTGFGLGVSVSDINGDNLPDIYISNDFWERDYLYINQGNGTFSEELTDRISMTSTASMGADIADIDNNGTYDIFSTDMLPATNERLKKTTIYNDYNLEDLKFRNDYHYQYTQNCLQLNLGDGQFRETAHLSGVAATDWSWGALIFDIDNDGWKDIFVSNGVYRDITDMDFSSFIDDNEAVKAIVKEKGRFDFRDFLPLLPSTPLSNYAFINQRNGSFSDKAEDIGLGAPSFSNGSAYGDLDNDGDLDLVLNNINGEASIFKNNVSETGNNHAVSLAFQGEGNNGFGIGAKVHIETANGASYHAQNYQSRGFQSATAPTLLIGIGTETDINSLEVNWPSGKSQTLNNISIDSTIVLKESEAASSSRDSRQTVSTLVRKAKFSPENSPRHVENIQNDFDSEILLTHMVSTEGPEVLPGDLNGDGKEDFILLGAQGTTDQVWIQEDGGSYTQLENPGFEVDREKESTAGHLIDLNKDGHLDLILGTGGNNTTKNFQYYLVRTYLNDGSGKFSKTIINGMNVLGNLSCIEEINWDGNRALFFGGRMVPGNYGLSPRNYLMLDTGNAWKDITSKETGQTGMVTDAQAIDLDNDGDEDLAVVGEWEAIRIYENRGNAFWLKGTIPGSSGLWQSLQSGDFNGDGLPDLCAGNWGNNSQLVAEPERPLNMLVGDLDANKKSEFIIEWYAPEDDTPSLFASKRNITSQLPSIRKKVLKNEEYARASLTDLIDENIIAANSRKKVETTSSGIYINNGDFTFTHIPLPFEGQASPIFASLPVDLNNDGNMDLITGGNLYAVKPDIGRLDSSTGEIFLGDGKGGFTHVPYLESGLLSKGEIRDIKIINDKTILIAKNNAEMDIYELNK